MRISLPLDKPTSPRATGRWKSNWFPQVVLLATATLLAAGVYGIGRIGTSPNQPAPTFHTVPAFRGALVSTIPAVGSVALSRRAQLGFGADGKLVQLDVAVGDLVKAGQQIARLDAGNLEVRVAEAESALKMSQLRLQQLQQGASAEEQAAARAAADAAIARFNEVSAGPAKADLLAAQVAVEHATTALLAAEAKHQELRRGPTQGEIAVAQADVDRLQSSLASVEAQLEKVKAGPSQTELGVSVAAVDSARARMKAAEARLAEVRQGPKQGDILAAEAAVEQARAALLAANDRVAIQNGSGSDREKLETGTTSAGQAAKAAEAAEKSLLAAEERLRFLRSLPSAMELQVAQSEVDEAKAQLDAAMARVDQVNRSSVPSAIAAAEQTVNAARSALVGAQIRLEQMMAGPIEWEVLSADKDVSSARAALAGAEAKLALLQAGPKPADVEAARSSVAGAEARLAQAEAGPDAIEVAMAEEKVRQAEIALQGAKRDLENAILVAPFDGTVAAVKPSVGEQVRQSEALITLVDPQAVRVDVTVEEKDVARISPGQQAKVSLEPLGEQHLQSRVIAVAPVGTTNQKAVTYLVSVGVESPGRTIPAGMSAKVSIETERKENVLLVPTAAVRGQGSSKTVQVMVEGTSQERPVQTGSTDEQYTEIVSGLDEGDEVVIRATYPATS